MANQGKRYMRMTDPEPEETLLPLWQKLCFAVGGVPYQMTTTVIGFFLNIFLLEVAELRPGYVAIVLFSGKAWDAVTDPTCGFLVQRTRTRWGRLRPWILFSAPFAVSTYFLLFYVPGKYKEEIEEGRNPTTDISMEGRLGYYLVMFCLFEGFLSCLHVPYTSLTMLVTTKQKERDSVTAFRMVFEAVGVLAAVVIQGQLVADTRCNGEEDIEKKRTIQDMIDQEWAYRTGSFIVVGLYLVCCLTVFFGVKEKEPTENDAQETTGFFAGLKLVFSYGPYMKAAMAFLFLSLAVGIVQGNVALYCTHSLKMGGSFSLFVLVLLSISIVSMPVWQCIVVRFGKKKAYAAGMILLIPTFSSLMYIPEKSMAAFYVVIVFAGFGISVALLLPWSVLPDVLDLFMLEKKTRQDAIFYAFYVFFNKLAIGLGLGLSQLALSVGGYKTGECHQPSSVGETLRLLVTPAPVVCVLIALIFLWLYPIDEKRRMQIRQDILLYQERTQPPLDASQATMSYESITVPAAATTSNDITHL
ncbi:sodium-dependent lysophosphatidylcholine symporter 1-A-like [Littorina saxatilis]|uniref:sodium-dependent lysophosphatidylcholine symporter 1-A-like n=1 Tax=Littorina saxatilis TaxID=31220 RepID=UPI0038B51647